MKDKSFKIVGYVVLAVLILNLLFFALGKLNGIFFWAIIIAGALFVYKILPKMRN